MKAKQITACLNGIEAKVVTELGPESPLTLEIQNTIAALRKVTSTLIGYSRPRVESQHSEIELIKAGQIMVTDAGLQDIFNELGLYGDGDDW